MAISIDEGNLFITRGTIVGDSITNGTNANTVKIDSIKLDFLFDNAMTVIPIPLSGRQRKNAGGVKNPESRVVNLLRLKETVNVQGFLPNESGNSSIDKRNVLIGFVEDGGALTVVWGQGVYQTLIKPDKANQRFGVHVTKLAFTETAGLEGVEPTGTDVPERGMAVQIQLIRGRDMFDDQ